MTDQMTDSDDDPLTLEITDTATAKMLYHALKADDNEYLPDTEAARDDILDQIREWYEVDQ